MAPLKVDISGNPTLTNDGPPTPTHSETQDCIDARKCKCYLYINLYNVICILIIQ